SSHSEEAPRQMSETETFEGQQQVGRWLAGGQDMLGRVIPALIEDRDRLRQTLEARERECEQLRGEGGELRRNLGALQSEGEKLRGERVAMADAFGRVLDLVGLPQRPLEQGRR